MNEERNKYKVYISERLTYPMPAGDTYFMSHFCNDESDIMTKLGKLEDLEDELDIDLLTLMKALKDGIYGKVGDSIEHILSPHLCMKCEEIYISKVKDYGKTWALTREELEK